jgi:hypothetical protein
MFSRSTLKPPALRSPFRSSERRTPERPCLNCGDPTPGNFCRTCGQRKVELSVSLSRMLMEALDDQFAINSALPRTMGALLGRPGHLTREYMSGRIARYIPPLRLYLVTSVAFFLALSFLSDIRNPNLDVKLGENGVRIGGADSARVERPLPAAPIPRPHPPGDSSGIRTAGLVALRPPEPPRPPRMQWLNNARANTGNPVIDSVINARIAHFQRMEPREAIRQVISDFLGHIPQVMFVLLPIFAFMLKLLYLGSKRFYVEHFVFALHVHAFCFVSYLAIILFRWPPLAAALCTWILIYIYWAMKKNYGQGWWATGVKYLMLGSAYFAVVAMAAAVTLLASVLTV